MMMACILTPWTGSGTVTPTLDLYRPKLLDDHPLTGSWSDVTGTPAANLIPAPNAVIIQVVCPDAWLAKVAADANYGPGILWSQTI